MVMMLFMTSLVVRGPHQRDVRRHVDAMLHAIRAGLERPPRSGNDLTCRKRRAEEKQEARALAGHPGFPICGRRSARDLPRETVWLARPPLPAAHPRPHSYR